MLMKIIKINLIVSWIRERLQIKYHNKGLAGLYIYNSVILSSALIKKNIFKEFYFDESLDIVGIEDYDLWLRFLRFTEKHSIH